MEEMLYKYCCQRTQIKMLQMGETGIGTPCLVYSVPVPMERHHSKQAEGED